MIQKCYTLKRIVPEIAKFPRNFYPYEKWREGFVHKFFSLDDFTTRNIEFINTPKNGYFDYKIKSLHKSKIGSLKKGWPYVFGHTENHILEGV